jgi:hypothetical protein
MAIAQGIARTQWFEAQNPVGEDQGFGLLERNGTARTSYTTFKTLTTYLGGIPKYVGWHWAAMARAMDSSSRASLLLSWLRGCPSIRPTRPSPSRTTCK